MEAVYQLALSKPFVESIAWGNLADLNHTLPGGGLLDDMLQPKPAFTKLQELREKFQQSRRSSRDARTATEPRQRTARQLVDRAAARVLIVVLLAARADLRSRSA